MPTAAHPPRSATYAFLAVLAVSVVALFLPEAPDGGVDVPGLDKAVHLALFAALTVTAVRRFGDRLGVVSTLAAYAGCSEVVQAVVLPERGGDVLDVAADLAGLALGLAVLRAWACRRSGSVPATSEPDEVDP